MASITDFRTLLVGGVDLASTSDSSDVTIGIIMVFFVAAATIIAIVVYGTRAGSTWRGSGGDSGSWTSVGDGGGWSGGDCGGGDSGGGDSGGSCD